MTQRGMSRRGELLFAGGLAAALAILATVWLREEVRVFQAWADATSARLQDYIEPWDYVRAIPGHLLESWRRPFQNFGWSPPLGPWAMGLAALAWLAGLQALGESVVRLILREKPHASDFPACLFLPVGFAVGGVAILGISLIAIRQAFFALILGAGMLAGFWRIARWVRAPGFSDVLRSEAKSPWNWATALFLTLSFVYALTPATQSDGMRYHLGALSEWIKAGRVTFLPHLSFAQFPFLVEIAWLPGLAATADPLLGGVFAQAVHWGLFATTLWVLSDLAEALAGASSPEGLKLARRLARLAWASTPSAAVVAGWCFIDHGIVLFFLALILALAWAARGPEDGLARRAFLAGMIAGGLLGTKYTMLAPAGLGGLWLMGAIWTRPERSFRNVARAALAYGLASALIGGGWFAKNWALAGNPVYPATAGGLFASPGWPEESSQLLRDQMDRKGWIAGSEGEPWRPAWWLAWATVATHWRVYEAQFLGMGFPLGFLVFGFWFLVGRRETPPSNDPRPTTNDLLSLALLQGVAFYALWCSTYLSGRLLMPLAALACVIPGALAGRFRESGNLWAKRAIVGAWAMIAGANFVFVTHWLFVGQTPPPLPAALGFEPGSAYLSEALNYADLATALNQKQNALQLHRLDPDSSGALLIGEHRPYYFNGRILFSDWFNPPAAVERLKSFDPDEDEWRAWQRDRIAYLGFNKKEFSQYAPLFYQLWLRDGKLKTQFEQLTNLSFEFNEREAGIFSVNPANK
jgi:hypothetical protein